jgi:hypothetical protein
MSDADVIIGSVEGGDVEVHDYTSSGQTTPSRDDSDDVLAFAGSESGGKTVIKFRRLLKTGDSADKDASTTKNCIVAFNLDSDNLLYHGSNQRSSLEVDLLTGIAEEVSEWMPATHGVMMATSWGLLIPIGIILARFFKHIGHAWFVLHTAVNTVAVALTLVAFIIAIVMAEEDFTQSRAVAATHAWFGLFVVIGATLQIPVGVLADRLWSPDRVKTPIFPDIFHWWVGRITLALSSITVILGFFALEISIVWVIIFIIWILIVIGSFITLEKFGKKGHGDKDVEMKPTDK